MRESLRMQSLHWLWWLCCVQTSALLWLDQNCYSSSSDWSSAPSAFAPFRPIATSESCAAEEGMQETWLDSDSPVFENIFTMDLLRSKEGSRPRLLVLAVVFGWCLASVRCFGQSQDSELTFLLPAGRSECFFQTAVNNGTMEVEYQVTVCRQHINYNYTLRAHVHVVICKNQQ